MRNYLLFLFHTGILFYFSTSANAQYVSIPDTNFRTYLETNFPSCMLAGKMDTTCTSITSAIQLDISSLNISDLTGVQYFDQLEHLACYENELTFLPPLPRGLRSLSCPFNKLISLPPLPSSMNYLSCVANNLSALPPLPPSLRNLYCDSNKIVTLPALPNSLLILWCSRNQLSYLPELPQALTELLCYKNVLTFLPVLPASLQKLNCEQNNLTGLPALPLALKELNASHNVLPVLPVLPQGLESLSCADNQLEKLPAIPSFLSYLHCSFNRLTSIPYLPDRLKRLICNNNALTALPYLPAELTWLSCSKNNITCLPVLPNALIYLVTDTLCRPNMPAALKTNVPFNSTLCSALTFTHTRVCAGDSTSFDLKDANCHAFLWDFDDPVTGANNTSTLQYPKHLFSHPGDFQVKLISYVTDPATVIIKTVTVDKLPRIDFGNDHSMCPDDGITLDAGDGFETYLWQDGSDVQVYNIKSAGDYSVTATNACGSVSAAIRLSDYTLIIPNLFTPNKDGYNETFEIKGTDGDYGMLEVFNAWGSQVFGAKRYYNNWNGEGLPEGIYYYSFTLKSCPGKKGWIQVMR